MEIDPATRADSAPVSFLDKFATVFTLPDRVQTNGTEERMLTFFRNLSERDPRVRNVDDPAKTVGWSDGRNDKASAESQESFSHFNQTSTNDQDNSTVNTVLEVTMSNTTEEDNATSPATHLQMYGESKGEACVVSLEQQDESAKGLPIGVSTYTSESPGHLGPTSEGTGASIPQVVQPNVPGAEDSGNGDKSVALHSDGLDVNTGADKDFAQRASGRCHPSEEDSNNSGGEKEEWDGKKDEIADVEKREIDSVAVDDTPSSSSSSPVGPSESPTTEAASSPREKSVQLQSLFSGLLKRASVGEEEEKATPGKSLVPQEQKTQPLQRGLFPEQSPTRQSPTRGGAGEPWGGFLEQLSQLLNLESSKVEEETTEEQRQMEESQTGQIHSESGEVELNQEEEKEKKEKNGEVEVKGEMTEKTESLPATKPVEETKKPTSSESALDAFKAFFTPKPTRKPTLDRTDLEALKQKMRSDREKLRAIFERNSPKTNSKAEDSPLAEHEERTPRRLQAIWPPPKPKDEVGLKYTEAEHQAALFQLKRECKEEVETLQAGFELQLFRVRGENAENVSRLEDELSKLQSDKDEVTRGDFRDACVSTEDDFSPRTFRTVCVQTDRETFIKPAEDEEHRSVSQNTNHSVPKKLNLTSLGLSGKTEPASAQEPPPFQQSDSSTTVSSSSLSPPVMSPGSTDLTPPPAPPLPGSLTSTSSAEAPQAPDGPPIPPPPPPPVPSCGPPPAPPPPPSHGGSPLPPPPFPGVGFALSSPLEKPPRKPALEPSCPMKPLYWTRIQIQDNNNDTLWSSLEEPSIDPCELEDLFAKATLQTKRKPLSEAYERRNKAKKIIKLLDSKRSQAVGIFISSLHLEMKDIKQAVLTVDNSVVDLETIEALYENRAQPGELEQLKKHYETSDEEQIRLLDKPEQFLYELSQIPDFSGRARCLIFQSVFADSIASIRRKVEIISRVCKGLLEEGSVRDVIGLVLALGNYMNGGNRTRGQADGFGLEILPKLKDVKSRDNRISLVDYVVSYYLRNLDENAGTDKSVFPLPEPQDVFLAAQVKFEDLFKDLRKLRKDLSVCEQDVQRVCASSSEEHLHPFKEKMEGFISHAQQDHGATEHQLICAQKSFHDLEVYLGVKPKSGEKEVMPGQVFMLWFEFCGDFKTRWKRESKNISKERLREAQQCVKNITGEKKVETRKVHANSLKERLRQKEASLGTS
ncbi:formin [Sardina pilchardus]|uniref:formin n=1 Tax=Sardina pilchardus TaxID=27697 RepID=UPI002E10FF89